MGPVEDATRSELHELRSGETSPGLAEAALTLARQLDEAEAPTAAAVVARELRATMLDLRKLAPAGQEGDTVDDIARQREKRREDARKRQSG